MAKQLREVYGSVLAELGETNPDIVVLDADLSGSTKSKLFADKHPDRFFNMGIAESNMVSTAAGLAAVGRARCDGAGADGRGAALFGDRRL